MSPKKVQPSKNKGTIDLSKKSSTTNSKTNGKQNQTNTNTNKTSKILGAIFVIAGLTVIGLLILYFFLSRMPYRKDPNMPIPTLNEIEKFTKAETITITGDVIPGEQVILYIDGKKGNTQVTADNSGKFEFEDVELENEGKITFEAATVRGKIFKRHSEMSNTITTEVDWTAPSNKVELQYEETNTTGTTTIEGDADKKTYVILRSDDTEYETKTDKDGHFTFEDVKVKEGKNTYNISIRDEAGNEVLSSEFEITNEPGDLNGPAASTTTENQDSEKLPEAAGELEKALSTILGNNIMLFMGLISIVTLGVSSTGVYFYSKRERQ